MSVLAHVNRRNSAILIAIFLLFHAFGFLYMWNFKNNNETFEKFKEYVANSIEITSIVGVIEDIDVYRVRFVDNSNDKRLCFAYFSTTIIGAKKTINANIEACGEKSSPKFKVDIKSVGVDRKLNPF